MSEDMRIKAEDIDAVMADAKIFGGRAARAAALLEQNGFKVTGFCGLKDYKGGKLKRARKGGK